MIAVRLSARHFRRIANFAADKTSVDDLYTSGRRLECRVSTGSRAVGLYGRLWARVTVVPVVHGACWPLGDPGKLDISSSRIC